MAGLPRAISFAARTGSARSAKFLYRQRLNPARPAGHQKPICCDTQRSVAVKAAPAPAFVVTEPELLLQILIVALDWVDTYQAHQKKTWR
jgi:hypothetical protein